MSGKIKTVIFDIGGVLCPYNWRDFIRELFGNEEITEKLYETLFRSGLWDEIDRGVWSLDQLLGEYIKRCPELEKEIRLFFEKCGFALHRGDYAADWIRELKERGYQVLYLSNYSRHVMNMNPEALYFLPLMDGGVFSCYVHLVKPDREIYDCIRDRYALNPSEAVFLDDHEKNVEGARAAGFHGIHFRSLSQAKEELNRLLEE